MRFLLLLSVLTVSLVQACSFDLVIKNGHVIDPANNRDGRMDVAIAGGKIARVEAKIATEADCKVVDASGLYVTPGLIDIHAHVYANTGLIAQYAGEFSLMPDAIAPRSGVTTIVDAGTSGWRNFEDFKKRVIDRSRTRVLAFVNVAGLGMSGNQNEQNSADMKGDEVAAIAKRYPEIIVGVKTAHYGAPDWIAVDQALVGGVGANIPVMVDFGSRKPERTIEELLLKKLRPGDIYTHVFSGLRNEQLPNGKLNPVLWEARKRGVLFDLGHGNGSFFWTVAKAAFAEKFYPDTLSTDLHIRSWSEGMKDLNNVMSKFLIHGLPLQQVVRMTTSSAAKAIKRPELGTLSVGSDADVAVLRLTKGKFGYLDNRAQRVNGNLRLTTELTLRGGKTIYDLNGMAAPEWKPGTLPGARMP
ncbi:amidohydrolase/deacetylase family metallohydrolase [Bryobacter aggregatus]|uniref:amidohydrolase/deacetylase family metallohydrolase n=1 Tax=Bryobacter aggregatus TaxID=360054 RepID=UPI00068D465B|nr:amidohydrolase/deacetylase family metallohydrolase [Bryobacter aggregatus]